MGQQVSHQKVFSKKKGKEQPKVYSAPVISDNANDNKQVSRPSLPSTLTDLDKGFEESESTSMNSLEFEPETTIFNEAKMKGRRVLAPAVLFFFDHKSKLLWVLDGKAMKWRFNDLLYSQFQSESSTFSRFEEAMFKAEFPEYIRNSTLIATDDSTIQILGRYHLEYKIWANSFSLKSEKARHILWPTACCSPNNIFCVSGVENGDFTKKCQRYIIDKQKWVSFQSIPEPHVEGSAMCYSEAGEDAGSFKLMVVGGYSSATPKITNHHVSIYDFKTDAWTRIPLNAVLINSLKLIRPPLVQSEDGRVFVFGSKDQWECFELNLEDRMLQSHGKMPSKALGAHKAESHFFVTENEEMILLLDEMYKNEKENRTGENSPLIKSIKDLSIWKFHLIDETKGKEAEVVEDA